MPKETETTIEEPEMPESVDVTDGIDDVVFDDNQTPAQEPQEPAQEPKKDKKAEADAGEDPEIDPLDILKGSDKDKVHGDKTGDGEGGDDGGDGGDPDVDGIAEPEFKTDDSKEGWNNLKSIAKERKDEIAQLQSKLENYEKGDVSQANSEVVKSLETQLQEARTRLAQYDASHLPEFQKKYESPIRELTSDMADLAQEFGISADVKWASFRGMSLKEASEKISDIADGNTVLENALMNKATEIRKLHRTGQAELENAGDFIQKSKEERLRESKMTFDRVAGEFKDNWSLAEPSKDADEGEVAQINQYNQSVKAIRANAEKIALGASGPEDISRVAMEAANFRHLMAHGLPRIGKVYQAVISKQGETIKELQAKLEGVTVSDARVSGTGTSTGSGEKKLGEMDLDEALSHVEF